MSIKSQINVTSELSHLKLQVYDGVLAKESFRHVFLDMPKVCKKEEFGLLMLNTLILSQLETFYREANLSIGFYLYVLGQSNSLKTTLSHYFTKYFDRSNFRSVMASLRTDTAAALEYKMSIFRDFPLIIDDYYPGVDTTEANNLKRKISFVTRKASERMSSGRMTGNMRKMAELPVRGVYIITAEDRLQGESNLARTLTIEIEHGDVNFDPLNNYTSAQLLMLPTFIYHFRQYIASNSNELPQILKNRFEKCKNYFIKQFDVSYAKMGEIFAFMMSSFILVLDFGKHINALSKDEDRLLFHKILGAISKAIEKQIAIISEYSPINMFCNILNEGIVLHKLKIKNIEKLQVLTDETDTDETDTDETDTNESANTLIDGWEDKDYYYFPENSLYKFVVNEYKRQNVNFPLTKNELFRRLAADKIDIIRYEKGFEKKDGSISQRYDIKKTINKKFRPRVIWICKNKLEIFKNESN